MKTTYSNFIEYQGISVVKKDIPQISSLTKQYFPAVEELRDNLHICLEYFSIRKQMDVLLKKEEKVFPQKVMGKQIEVPLIAIGGYYKNGKLLNVAFLIDDSFYDTTTLANGKKLRYYDAANMPFLTVWTNKEKINGKHIASAKFSGRCFGSEPLAEDESIRIFEFDKPIMITGELCAFGSKQVGEKERKGYKIFNVKNSSTRLISNKSLIADTQAIMDAEFEKPVNVIEEQRKKTAENAAKKIFG